MKGCGKLKINKKALIIIMIMVILIGGVLYTIGFITHNFESLSQVKMQSFDMSKIKNGVFKGSYSSLPVSATVEVTIQDKSIIQINLLKHFNGQGTKAESILNQVVDRQNVNVDTISGATYSSIVILKAVEDALNKSVGTN